MGKITPLFGDKAGESARAGKEPVLSDLIAEMTAQLSAAKNEIAESNQDERRLATQAEYAARATTEWEQRAMAAVRAGDDVVAREALLRKAQHESQYEHFRAAEKDQHQKTAAMTRALVTLNFRVEEAKRRRDAVVVHAERAGALPPLAKQIEFAAIPQEADTMRDPEDLLKRLEAKMTDIEGELELSDEAIANLTREASDAIRSRDELTRLQQKADRASSHPSKPLAKTRTSDLPAKSAPPVVGSAERTKR
jgi:phage shock protein A